MDNVKVGFSLNADVLSRLDNYRREKGLTRSACVTAILNDYFNSLETAKLEMERMNRFAKVLGDYTNGTISAADFQTACAVLSKSQA